MDLYKEWLKETTANNIVNLTVNTFLPFGKPSLHNYMYINIEIKLVKYEI